MADLILLLIQLLNLYTWVLIIRFALTWFPNINWYNQPWRFLRSVTDPVLEPFQRLNLTFGNLDLSPMVLLFALYLLRIALTMLLRTMVGF